MRGRQRRARQNGAGRGEPTVLYCHGVWGPRSQAKVDVNPDMVAGRRGLCDQKGPSFMWVESSGVPFTLE